MIHCSLGHLLPSSTLVLSAKVTRDEGGRDGSLFLSQADHHIPGYFLGGGAWIFLYWNACLPEPWVTNMISMSREIVGQINSNSETKEREYSYFEISTSGCLGGTHWGQGRVIHKYV